MLFSAMTLTHFDIDKHLGELIFYPGSDLFFFKKPALQKEKATSRNRTVQLVPRKLRIMAIPVRIPKGPLYIDIDGYRVNGTYPVDLYRSGVQYEPRPDDKFVVTFQKCGTTWCQQIGYLIFHRGVPPATAQEFFKASPFLEMYGGDAARIMERPGLIKTHLPYHLAPHSSEAKYLVMVRNPKDVCVSLFYHTRDFAVYDFRDGTFENFFEVFLKGDTDNGDYFENVLSWYNHRNDPNVLVVLYEDMKANPRELVLKMAGFLDEACHKLLTENEDILRDVLKYSTFTFMKLYFEERFQKFYTEPLEQEDSVPSGLKRMREFVREHPGAATFTRKGIVGDWKSHFTPQMNARMEERMRQKFSHTDLIDIWSKYGLMST